MADTSKSSGSESKPSESRRERLDRLNREDNQELIFKGYARLEIHKIIIDRIAGDQRKFDKIIISSALSFDDPLYKRKDGEKIPLGKPLRLCGPSRPPACEDPVSIYIGPVEWKWFFGYDESIVFNRNEDSGPISKEVVAKNGSKARVFYERIVKSVEADVEITFCFEDLDLQIQGEISATTNGNPDTKRVLLCLDDDDTSVKPDTPLRLDRSVVALPIKSVKPDTPLRLDRSVVALPIKSALHLSFDLTLKLYDRKIGLKLDDPNPVFDVPEGVEENSREIQVKVGDSMQKKLRLMQKKLYSSEDNTVPGIPEDFKIKIKVAWSNDFCCYFDDDEIAEFDISSGSGESEYSSD